MGMGWNLGNTLDGLGYNSQHGDNVLGWETAWGNPVTTRALINSIADRGFDHIRIPFSVANSPPHPSSRYTDMGANTPDGQLRFVINQSWLDRYYELVQWSLDAGLYVMVNLHHDSWTWIGRQNSEWGGYTDSWQYRKFRDIWTQLAQMFAHMPDQVMFETINEPHFENHPVAITEQQMLNWVNQTAFDIIRATPGNETRIVVIPTVWTRVDAGESRQARNFIYSLNDENVIATVHYYGEWVFGANLGMTLFDEILWDTTTTRTSARATFETLNNYFMSVGIGLNIGEWGLLAYDAGHDILQTGEELKYYEYINYLARDAFNGVNLTFWDNGSGIDRRSSNYTWMQSRVGEMMEASLFSRSSYSAGLDTLYFQNPVTADVNIPLTLNGNNFVGIRGLTEGTHFTFSGNTVTLTQSFVNERFAAMGNAYGVFADLILEFSAGADWRMFLVRNGTPQFYFAEGTRGGSWYTGGIFIPVELNGNHVRRVSASQNGQRVGGTNLWWPFLQNGGAFRMLYDSEEIRLLPNFFSGSVVQGQFTVNVEMFDGQVMDILLYSHGVASNSVVSTIAPPMITTTTLPFGTVNRAYNQQLEATGIEPILWSLDSGNLPTGLTLSDAGAIQGTPTAIGTFTFTVTATDANGSASRELSIEIRRVPLPTPTPTPQPEESAEQEAADPEDSTEPDETTEPSDTTDGNDITDGIGDAGNIGEGHGQYTPDEQQPVVVDRDTENRWTPGFTPPAIPPIFQDVPTTAWYANYVHIVTAAGLFQGTAPEQFSPNGHMTRAMFAQVLANLDGINLPAFVTITVNAPSFGDVAPDAWYFASIEWAASLGVVQGVGGGNFAPATPITREQMAVMLFRFMESVGISLPMSETATFHDQNAISPWAAEAVAAIQAMGLIQGANGYFSPNTLATRAQVAAIFARLLDLLEQYY